jgi:hypothetical protein
MFLSNSFERNNNSFEFEKLKKDQTLKNKKVQIESDKNNQQTSLK